MLAPADTQTAFAQALRQPTLPMPDAIEAPLPNSTQSKRFDVYRNNVVVAALDALEEMFPVVQQLVGEAFFRATARAYFDEHPPRSALLFEYGDTFGDFLDGFPPAQSVPYLGDMARLEFARVKAYHAADADALGIETLGTIAPETLGDLRFTAHPSVSLIRSRFAIGSIWAASSGHIDADQVDPMVAQDVMILRKDYELDTRVLPDGTGAFLSALLSGASLGEAAAAAEQADLAFDLGPHLAGLFQTGAFHTLIAAEPSPHSGTQPDGDFGDD